MIVGAMVRSVPRSPYPRGMARAAPTTNEGSLERALELIGTRSAMTLLREAFYGARRFDDLVSRAGLSSMAASARLKEFVAAGLMVRRPYQSPNGTRCEYVLTDLGNECLPVVLAMMRFGAAVETASQTAEVLADHG